MSDPTQSLESESDFSAQLEALIIEAEQQMDGLKKEKASKQSDEEAEIKKAPVAANKEVQEPHVVSVISEQIVSKIEVLINAKDQHSSILEKVVTHIGSQETLPALLNEVKATIERKNSVNKAMFDALHVELKGYKDAFILDAVLRPVIRDIIALYDDAFDIHKQLGSMLITMESGENAELLSLLLAKIKNTVTRTEHHTLFLLEILERLDVTQMPKSTGRLDKQNQKAVSVESTEDMDEDQSIVRTVKCGFMWRERIFRPEEVVIKKWQPQQPIQPDLSTQGQMLAL